MIEVGPRGQIGASRDVKPPQVRVPCAGGVDEALALLGRYGGEAKLLAGGQSLMPLLNFRLARPAALVDLNGIGSLAYIREEDGAVAIGAMTRQRTIEFSPVVRRRLPLLTEATALVGHLPIRTRGTIGGSIAHADPSAEYPAVLTALDGVVVVRGPRGERTLKPSELFQTLSARASRRTRSSPRCASPRCPRARATPSRSSRGATATSPSSASPRCSSGKGGRCTAARLATAGAGPVPVRLRAAEEILERDGLGDASLDAAAARAAELVDPDSDIHASAAYRKNLTRVLTGRVLRRAMARMTETEQDAEKGPSASLAPSAARSRLARRSRRRDERIGRSWRARASHREYASRAAVGRRLASGPFCASCLALGGVLVARIRDSATNRRAGLGARGALPAEPCLLGAREAKSRRCRGSIEAPSTAPRRSVLRGERPPRPQPRPASCPRTSDSGH